MKKAAILFLLLLSQGCTSVLVEPLAGNLEVEHICIEQNSKVTVPRFLEIVVEIINRHGITTELFEDELPGHCEFTMIYTARRSWDFATYLSVAELRILQKGKSVAAANYRLRGKGGLSLTKWASVESKMTPVVNELLAQYASAQ